MDKERKRQIALIALVSISIIFGFFYFIWGNFINKGTLSFTGRPPYKIEIIGDKTYECEKTPCEIKQKIGTKDIIAYKEGYESNVIEGEVNLFGNTKITLNFEKIPAIKKTDKFPETEKQISYKINFDKEKNLYKLINEDDTNGFAIVYFQNTISAPKIFGNKYTALVIDTANGDTYKVDILGKKREKLSNINLKDIENGEFDKDGKNFIYSKKSSNGLGILDQENKITTLSLNKGTTTYSLKESNKLFFATSQANTISENMEFLPEISDMGIAFGYYNPSSATYTKIWSFNEITTLPSIIIPSSNEKIIYFKVGEEQYVLEI
jgi:hypothetical protein